MMIRIFVKHTYATTVMRIFIAAKYATITSYHLPHMRAPLCRKATDKMIFRKRSLDTFFSSHAKLRILKWLMIDTMQKEFPAYIQLPLPFNAW